MPHIHIDLEFEWSPWVNWESLAPFRLHPARGPLPAQAGVYEVRATYSLDPDQRLLIGSSPRLTNLYEDLFAVPARQQTRKTRLRGALAIQVQGDVSRLEMRWATIEAPYRVALEWTLIRNYKQRFGQPPACASQQ